MEQETELRLRVEEGEKARTIRAEGELSITTAAALKMALIASLETGAQTIVDTSRISAVDLTGLQLLCSAHRTYRAHDVTLEFCGVSEILHDTAITAGFEASHSSCPRRGEGHCLWRFECQKSS